MRATNAINNIYTLLSFSQLIFAVFFMKITKRPRLHDSDPIVTLVLLYVLFLGGLWKSDYDFLIVINSNFLFAMHGFRDNEVLLPTGYDVIVVLLQGALYALHDGFWKSDHDFLIFFEKTRFYCKPVMTSSWFLRQRASHAILHDDSEQTTLTSW